MKWAKGRVDGYEISSIDLYHLWRFHDKSMNTFEAWGKPSMRPFGFPGLAIVSVMGSVSRPHTAPFVSVVLVQSPWFGVRPPNVSMQRWSVESNRWPVTGVMLDTHSARSKVSKLLRGGCTYSRDWEKWDTRCTPVVHRIKGISTNPRGLATLCRRAEDTWHIGYWDNIIDPQFSH